MPTIWYNRIFDGTHKLSDVPIIWKAEVEAMIETSYSKRLLEKNDYHRMLNVNESIISLDDIIDEYINA